MQPLILTLAIDSNTQAFFDELRQRHFPPERNFLKAHLTLFHQLPHEAQIFSHVNDVAAKHAALDLRVSNIVSIEKGVAYKIDCPELKQLHRFLQQQWQQWLTPQDRQSIWPHITIQNKVAPATASALQRELAQSFAPFDATGTGLILWEYLNGPWKQLQYFPFVGV